MRKFLLILLFLGLGLGFYIFYANFNQKPAKQTPKVQQEVNDKASFAIFTNGTFRIFTAAMYHNRSSVVFIEESNPNIVHVKKKDTTWNDFFKTLPLKLTKECLTTGTGQVFCSGENGTLKFYINQSQDKDALFKKIQNGDQLLVSFGSESQEEIKQQFEKIPKP